MNIAPEIIKPHEPSHLNAIPTPIQKIGTKSSPITMNITPQPSPANKKTLT